LAVYNKFNVFTQDLVQGAHNFSTNTFKVMLTDVAPIATNAVKANITEIAAGNGYSAGGTATTIGLSNTSGTETVTATTVTITASGGSIAQFRYAVLYNSTQTTPLGPLVAWFDNGSEINLTSGSSVQISFPSNLYTLV
jgi:hypothetical protein